MKYKIKPKKISKKLNKFNLLSIASFTYCLNTVFSGNAIAGALPDKILWGKPTCDVSTAEILRKHELRKSALVKSPRDQKAQDQYQAIIQKIEAERDISKETDEMIRKANVEYKEINKNKK